jgi:hypothetical protein
MLRATWQRRSFYPAVAVVMAVLVIGSAVIFGRGAAVGAPQATTVELVLPAQARAGELITVRLVARNAQNLAGFQSTVVFDSTRLRLTSATIEKGLEASGRQVLQLGPILRDDSVVLGAATCPLSTCSEPRSTQATRFLRGVDGQVELGTVSFYTEIPGQYQLKLAGVQLIDPQGNRLTVSSTSTALAVIGR